MLNQTQTKHANSLGVSVLGCFGVWGVCLVCFRVTSLEYDLRRSTYAIMVDIANVYENRLQRNLDTIERTLEYKGVCFLFVGCLCGVGCLLQLV